MASEPSPIERLTEVEKHVLELLVQGRKRDEIADEMEISGETVASHVQSIFVKLGVHSRLEAAARIGLPPPPLPFDDGGGEPPSAS